MDLRNAPSPPRSPTAPPLHTPLIWAWGGLVLTATLWLTSIIALFHSIVSLFD